MLESSWALEWMCCSRGRWNIVCLVVWEGMYVSRYSDKQVRYMIFYFQFNMGWRYSVVRGRTLGQILDQGYYIWGDVECETHT